MNERALLHYHISRILRRSRLFPGRRLTAEVIMNLQAGSLAPPSRAAATLRTLHRLSRGVRGPVRDEEELQIRFHTTRYVGHAREISESVLATTPDDLRLIISVGGDGTHSEVLGAYKERESSGEPSTYFVRLPFGTGNDGADSMSLAGAVRLLLGDGRPGKSGRVVFAPRGMRQFQAFNIGSLGLDAYIAYLTNRLKGKLGGDLYKTIADVMTLFYERIVGAKQMELRLVGEDGRQESLEDRFLLVAVGASGYRRYGGGKLVLPGYENLCAISRIGTIGKIRLKSLFYRGDHVDHEIVRMRSVRALTINYEGRIPMQVDGESLWLDAENFPVEVSLEPARVPILEFE